MVDGDKPPLNGATTQYAGEVVVVVFTFWTGKKVSLNACTLYIVYRLAKDEKSGYVFTEFDETIFEAGTTPAPFVPTINPLQIRLNSDLSIEENLSTRATTCL